MKKALALLAALATFAAFGQETAPAPVEAEASSPEAFTAWTVSGGLIYRNFKDTKLKAKSAGSFEDYVVYGGGIYEPTQANLQAALKEIKGGVLPANPCPIPKMNFASYNGSSSSGKEEVDSSSKYGPAIAAETNLFAQDELSLNLALGFSYFNISTTGAGNGAGGVSLYSLHGVWTGAQVVPNYDGDKGAATGNAATNVSSKVKFDADLYVFDLGLKAAFGVIDDLSLFLAAGPTFSLADMKSSGTSGIFSDGAALSGGRYSDDKWQYRWGYYVAAGAKYNFNENWGLSAELRYDDTFGDIGTKLATQRLETFGGLLKVSYSF